VVGSARADVAPPPTLVLDSLYLGSVAGPVIAVALFVTALAAFLWMREIGVRRWVAIVSCLSCYVAVNIAIYAFVLAKDQQAKDRRRQEFRPRHVEPPGAKEDSSERIPSRQD
jgi:hypothetical protein